MGLPALTAILRGEDRASPSHRPAASAVARKHDRSEVIGRIAGLGLPALAAVLRGEDRASLSHSPAVPAVARKYHRHEIFEY